MPSTHGYYDAIAAANMANAGGCMGCRTHDSVQTTIAAPHYVAWVATRVLRADDGVLARTTILWEQEADAGKA